MRQLTFIPALGLLAVSLGWATGTVSSSISQVGISDTWVVAYSWVADSNDGSVPVTPAVNLPPAIQGYWPFSVETVPGSPSPTSGYSVAVLDASGADLLAAAANSLSATAGQSWAVASSIPPLNGVLSLKVTGNSVHSAQGAVYVFLTRLRPRPGLGGATGATGPQGPAGPPGTGSVTSVAAGCGLAGGPVTTTGTLVVSPVVKAVSAGSYTLLAGDCGGTDQFTGASPAVTIPTAGGSFPNGWYVYISFTGSGTQTLTPASGTINGVASVTVTAANGAGGFLVSDGSNWEYVSGGATSSGTVTSIATGCGLTGGPITGSGTVSASDLVNAQSGTTYVYLNSDCGKLVTHSNGSAIAGTLPQANGSTFVAGWFLDVQNTGVGTLTITPTVSAIDGNATLVLATAQGARIFSNGTNYFTQRGMGSAGTTSNTHTTFSNVASVAITLIGASDKAVFDCWDTSGSPARWFLPDHVSVTDADTVTAYFIPNATGYCNVSIGSGGGGGGSPQLQLDNANVGSPRSTLDYLTGPGTVVTLTDTGTKYTIETDVDTAVIPTKAAIQTGAPLLVTGTSSSPTVYTGTMSPTLTAYTSGMVVNWKVPTSCTGATATGLNIDALGAKSIKQVDGTTDPAASQCVSGYPVPLWYDGTVFRIVTPLSSGGGSATFDATSAIDKTVTWFREDFMGSVPSGVGSGIFRVVGNTGGDTETNIASEPNHWGLLHVLTGATTNNDAALDMLSTGYTTSTPRLDTVSGWKYRAIFRLNTIANVALRLGFSNAVNGNATTTDGVYLRFNTVADTNYFFVCRSGGVETAVDSTVAPGTSNWMVLDIYSDMAGTIKFALNGGAVTSTSTNVPTIGLGMGMWMSTLANAAKSIDLDLIALGVAVTR